MENDGSGGSGLLPIDTELHGRYRILRVIGRGGMSAVYEAEHLGLGKKVAIKEMTAAERQGPEVDDAIRRFQTEARTLAGLEHRYFPNVTDFFSQANRYYLVMEYVHGETLENLVSSAKGFIPEETVLRWGVQLCDVLSYLHSQSPPVVFRDLKPSNVMVDEHGQVKLIDFGIARFFKPGKQSDTQMMGTAGYSAPEQYGTGQTDARSDIYALGACLHYLLTRRDPTASPFNFPPVREINPAISANTERVVAKCLNMKAEDRYNTAADVKRSLGASVQEPETTFLPRPVRSPVMSASGISAMPVSPAVVRPPATSPASGGASWTAVIAVLLLTLLAAGAGAYFLFADHTPPPVKVPDVTHQDQTTARQILGNSHLAMLSQGTEASDVPDGVIDRQEPAPGSTVPTNQPISVWISSGPATAAVPSVVGLPEDVAKKELAAAGLRSGRVTSEYDDATPPGGVLRSSPDAGVQVPVNRDISLVLSKGARPKPAVPAPTPPPAVVTPVTPTTPPPAPALNLPPPQPNFSVKIKVPPGGASHKVHIVVRQTDGAQPAIDLVTTEDVAQTIQAPNQQSISATVDDKPVTPQIDPITQGSGGGGLPGTGGNDTLDTAKP